MRFSLQWLFAAVLFVAVSVVAALNVNASWIAAFRGAIVVIFPLAVIAAICSVGWIGFAVAGWLHLFSIALNYVPPFHKVNPESVDPVALWMHSKTGREEGVVTVRPHYAEFLIVYHCSKTMAFAFLGGYVAVWFYSRRDASR